MRFVLDPNAVSERSRIHPNAGLIEWHEAQNAADLFVTTITLAEVWNGFYGLDPASSSYDRIKRFTRELPERYRILNFDRKASEVWGQLTARSQGPLPLRDSFIAAIARSRGYRVVTRDAAVFDRMGCKVVNPWT